MERYKDKYIIVKDTKDCESIEGLFEDDGWSKRNPVAIVDNYDDAKDFIKYKNNVLYHLALIDHGHWEIHPDSNENHRVYYKHDDSSLFGNKIWFVKFYFYAVGYYK
ncbi:MAG: hypothetical protein LIR46_12875 [Bacteroidota bacterium]|nr:hypothetical protein [Bacteroidota bacterium]